MLPLHTRLHLHVPVLHHPFHHRAREHDEVLVLARPRRQRRVAVQQAHLVQSKSSVLGAQVGGARDVFKRAAHEGVRERAAVFVGRCLERAAGEDGVCWGYGVRLK